MVILQILPELNVGGVETGTVDLAKYLVKNGHKSLVVSNGGTLVHQLEKNQSHHFKLPVHKKNLWVMCSTIKPLRKLIVQHDVDVVHARSRVPAWIAYFATRGTKAKFMTTCHGYYKSLRLSSVMGWGKLVIVPSRVIGRHMIEDFCVPAQQIRYIPRSVDLERFHMPGNGEGISCVFDRQSSLKAPVVAILGRITPLKGHLDFLKAMAQVVARVPDTKIWIIGDVPVSKSDYKQELHKLVNRLGIINNVEFLGNRSDVPQLLVKVNVLCLSTVTQEAFGRVILEGQAVGVPVVATKVGGVVDIIDDHKTGLLVEPKDPGAMANAVLEILDNPQMAEELVVAAREKLEANFTLEHMALKTVAVYEELINSMNMLVIKVSSIGDVILATASLKALRRKFSHAQIYCLVGLESRKVLAGCPYLDGIIVYDHKDRDAGWSGVWRIGRRLRQYKFDKVVDLQNNRKSHVIGYLSMARERYGYANKKWGFLLSSRADESERNFHPVEHQFKVLKMLGLQYRKNILLELSPSIKDKEYVADLLESFWLLEYKRIVGINISASLKWTTKNWPIEHIARLCDLLAAKSIRVIITGTDKDKAAGNELLKLTKSKPANMIGKTDVMQLAALISTCHVYVSVDSAPLHIAAAVETPIIALFGPTSSARHLPPAKQSVVIEKNLTCSPCYSSRCRILTHACMRDITPEEVFEKIEKILNVKV